MARETNGGEVLWNRLYECPREQQERGGVTGGLFQVDEELRRRPQIT